MKPHASGSRATYLTIMNEAGVASIPNWRVADIYSFPKHTVPAPCQRANVEIKDYGSEANEFLYLNEKKAGDIPIANSCPIMHPICQVWKILAQTACEYLDIIALVSGYRKFPHFKKNSDPLCFACLYVNTIGDNLSF